MVQQMFYLAHNKLKNMKNLILLILLIISISCKSQQVYPLNTDLDEVPNNSYLKDSNNELASFIGNYTSIYQNNTITLYITKEIQKPFRFSSKNLYKDVLSVRYIVKNSSGITLQDTQNMSFQPYQIKFTIYSIVNNVSQNTVSLYYGGTNCGIGWGEIILKKINSAQISWTYNPNSSLIDSATCPPSTDKTVYLPVTNDLIFNKQ